MEKVNVIVGRFQPFTNGHIKGAEAVVKEHGLRTVFLIINTPEDKTDLRHPFPSDVIIRDNSGVKEGWFAGMFPIQNADIGKIASVCRDNGFEPVMWTCGSDRVKAYSAQVQEKYIKMYDLDMDFKVNEIHRTDDDISASQVRQFLIDDNITGFKKMMPRWVWGRFGEYRDIVIMNKDKTPSTSRNVGRKRMKSLKESLVESLN